MPPWQLPVEQLVLFPAVPELEQQLFSSRVLFLSILDRIVALVRDFVAGDHRALDHSDQGRIAVQVVGREASEVRPSSHQDDHDQGDREEVLHDGDDASFGTDWTSSCYWEGHRDHGSYHRDRTSSFLDYRDLQDPFPSFRVEGHTFHDHQDRDVSSLEVLPSLDYLASIVAEVHLVLQDQEGHRYQIVAVIVAGWQVFLLDAVVVQVLIHHWI